MRFSSLRWTKVQLQDLANYAVVQLPMDFSFGLYHRKLEGQRFPWFREIGSAIEFLANGIWCAVTDHVPQDRSDIGPEYGHEVISCSRCGKTLVDHWYY